MKIRVQTPLGEIELHSRRLPDGHTVWSQMPDFSRRVASAKQQCQNTRFRDAALYARKAARTVPIYAELAARSSMKNAYNIAMSDWFHPPEIPDVDVTEWTGKPGQLIRILAVDDVQVKQVRVVITDEEDGVLEQGTASMEDGGWWMYRTTAPARGNPKVLVRAEDLPGHVTEVVKPLPDLPPLRSGMLCDPQM